jgi:alkane 1-monooxygenase
MLNAPRHSDHHAHPARAYPALRLGAADTPGRPVLPRSLPVMATLAMVPPLWRRMMDPRVAALSAR